MKTNKKAKTVARTVQSVLLAMVTFTLMIVLSPEPAAYAAGGDLDPTFGTNGKVVTDFSGLTDFGNAVAIQSDGKIIVAGETSNNFSMARYDSNGFLDPTFGTNGKAVADFGASDRAYAVAIQSDDKIVLAGTTGSDFAVARFNSNGFLDPIFGSSGKVITNYSVSGSGDSGRAVALQSDGKIVVAGYSVVPSEFEDFALLRYNTDGSLDTSFNSGGIGSGTPGIVITPMGSMSEDKAYAVAIQSADGKIVVAGATNFNNDFAVARYTSAGVLDTTFDGDGKVTTDFGSEDAAYAVAIQTDGKIVVAGESKVNDPASSNCIISTGFGNPHCEYLDFSLARYNSNGSLDTSFSGDGKVTTDLNLRGNDDAGRGVAIQTNGKIVVAGYSETSVHDYSSPPNDIFSANNQFSLARYNSDGLLDTSFSDDGKVVTDFDASSDEKGNAVAIQTDGKIVVAGTTGSDFAVARYDGDVVMKHVYLPLIIK